MYTEDFVKIVKKEDLEYVIKAIKEVHSVEAGWTFGEIKKEELDDGRIRITVPLTKNKVK